MPLIDLASLAVLFAMLSDQVKEIGNGHHVPLVNGQRAICAHADFSQKVVQFSLHNYVLLVEIIYKRGNVVINEMHLKVD